MTVRDGFSLREARDLAALYPMDTSGRQCAEMGGRYICTRPAGHDGPHVAHSPFEVVATWEPAPHAFEEDQEDAPRVRYGQEDVAHRVKCGQAADRPIHGWTDEEIEAMTRRRPS